MPVYFTGGSAPGGSTTQVQVNTAGVFAGDSNFTWVPASGLTVAGNTHLQIGLPEPDLSGQDGPSNSFGVARTFPSGGYNLANFVAAGTSPDDGAANFISFYTSNGTVSAPTNMAHTTIMMGISALGYLSGSYQYLADISMFWNGTGASGSLGSAFAGAINTTINDINSQEIGETFLWSPDGTAIEFSITNFGEPPTGIGFSPLSPGVGEFNDGTPVGNGGSLADLRLGSIRVGNLTASKPVFTDASKNLISAQGASVADATDNATAITQLNALISRLEGLNILATI